MLDKKLLSLKAAGIFYLAASSLLTYLAIQQANNSDFNDVAKVAIELLGGFALTVAGVASIKATASLERKCSPTNTLSISFGIGCSFLFTLVGIGLGMNSHSDDKSYAFITNAVGAALTGLIGITTLGFGLFKACAKTSENTDLEVGLLSGDAENRPYLSSLNSNSV